MTSPAALTVVIPTHNRRDLMLRTLDSVLRQEGVALRVVVVDDGGSDGSADAVRDLRLPHVTALRHPVARGVSAARNAGLATVDTPFTAFVDDDDLWAPQKAVAQIAALEAHPAARWACVGSLFVDGELRVRDRAEPPPSGNVTAGLLRRNVIPGGGSSVLVETGLATEVGGFDEDISVLADWEFNLRLSLRSPVAAVDRPLMAYYLHLDSMFHDPAGLLRELHYLEAKHGAHAGGPGFAFHRGRWGVRTVQIAHRQGDTRTAGRMFLRAMARHPGSMVAEVLHLLHRKLRPPVPESHDESFDWLDRYRRPQWA